MNISIIIIYYFYINNEILFAYTFNIFSREAEELKQKILKFNSGTSLLQDKTLWATQQQLQKVDINALLVLL